MPGPLPIDACMDGIVGAIRGASSLVLVAEPGAGKTTRVPWALHRACLSERGQIVVLQPRRIAARLAAERVADERAEKVGETVGFQVRFQRVVGPRTRIQFVTEGVLMRQLLADPQLSGVSVVVLDEFHERSLHADLTLALLRRLQRTQRPDLKLLVMSATLAAEAVADYLACEVMRVAGAPYEVAIEYVEPADAARGLQASNRRPLEQQVAQQVRRVLAARTEGDILVFLPGALEIRRAEEACAELCAIWRCCTETCPSSNRPAPSPRAVGASSSYPPTSPKPR